METGITRELFGDFDQFSNGVTVLRLVSIF